jgi:hypothetical protein
MPKPAKVDPHWQATINGYRIGVMRVIASINNGVVEEVDLEKLNNFAQFALALMEISGQEKWTRAKMNAEMMNYLKQKENKNAMD